MKLTISIPKPCHEDWGAMRSRTGGRYCDTCQHTVADLTRATDPQLVALFTSDARPKCARFDPDQLDRVLANGSGQDPVQALRATVLSSALALGVGPVAAQTTVGEPMMKGEVRSDMQTTTPGANCVVLGGIKSSRAFIGDTVAVVVPEENVLPIVRDEVMRASKDRLQGQAVVEEGVPVTGSVVDAEDHEPIAFATVLLDGTRIAAQTDMDGTFALFVPDSLLGRDHSLRVRTMGYADQLVPLPPPQPMIPEPERPTGDPAAHGTGTISGLVRDATGNPVVNALVTLEGTGVFQYTDEHGLFGFDPTKDYKQKNVRLKIMAQGVSQVAEVPRDRVPFSVPVRLPVLAVAAVEPASNAHVDVGVVRMGTGERYIMGDMRIVRQSTGQRLTAPFRRAGRWVGDLFE